jgi:hypothetical protein
MSSKKFRNQFLKSVMKIIYLYAYIINTFSNYIPIIYATIRRKGRSTNHTGLAVQRTVKKQK